MSHKKWLVTVAKYSNVPVYAKSQMLGNINAISDISWSENNWIYLLWIPLVWYISVEMKFPVICSQLCSYSAM